MKVNVENYVNAVREIAKELRRAKEAHTAWEAKFEGTVPAHDWEVWYAQWIVQDQYAGEGKPAALPMAQLHTLVGPLA
jgi:hypothetical protein